MSASRDHLTDSETCLFSHLGVFVFDKLSVSYSSFPKRFVETHMWERMIPIERLMCVISVKISSEIKCEVEFFGRCFEKGTDVFFKWFTIATSSLSDS